VRKPDPTPTSKKPWWADQWKMYTEVLRAHAKHEVATERQRERQRAAYLGVEMTGSLPDFTIYSLPRQDPARTISADPCGHFTHDEKDCPLRIGT
jgi:hypothetical protein